MLSDVHGNALALEAVLADARAIGFDVMVDLGDTVSGPLWPEDTLALMETAGALAIRGNHDRVVGCDAPETMYPTDRFAHERLGAGARAALAARPATLRIGPVLAVHGTPASDMDYLLHEATAAGVLERRGDAVAALLGDTGDAEVILCGHTHRAHSVRLADGRLVVNPGSVGQPGYSWDVPVPHVMEAGAPHARWALLERTTLKKGGGKGAQAGWEMTHRMVVYDWEKASAEAARHGRAEWARSLATGFTA